MRPSCVGIAACAILLLAGNGRARSELVELQAEPISIPAAEALLQQWRSGASGSSTPRMSAPPAAAASDSLVYENVAFAGTFIAPGPGFELADDIHMVTGGLMTRFEFAYAVDQQDPVAFLCVFRANTTGNTPGDIIAGPFLLQGTTGAFAVRLTLVSPQLLSAQTWFGMAFSTDTAGVGLSGPPTIGTSNNMLYDVDRARPVVLQGVPSSFYLRVWVLKPVAVAETTWSAVKSLYAGH